MNAKKYILSIGAGWQQNETIKELQQTGYKVLSIDGDKNAPGFQYSEEYEIIDIRNSDEIIKFINNFDLLCAIAPNNDIGQKICSLINQKFSLPGISLVHAKLSSNKSLWRSKLDLNNINQPSYFYFSSYQEFINKLKINIKSINKVVIKPNDGSGSRGVFFLNHPFKNKFLKKNIQTCINNSYSKMCVCEEFIDGTEYSVEIFTNNYGIHKILLVSKRHMGEGASAIAIEEININNNFEMKLQKLVNTILDIFDYKIGLTHLEIIEHDGDFFPIDIAFRGGGYWVSDKLLRRRISKNINVLLVNALLNFDTEINFSSLPNAVLVYPRNSYNSQEIKKLINGNLNKVDHMYFDPSNKISDDSDSSRHGIELWEKLNEKR